MSDYGNHPTQYAKLSDGELYNRYLGSTNLTEVQKLDLLQEIVNRDAIERGMLGAPKVENAELPLDIKGQANNGIITVDLEKSDNIWDTLNTVLHENIHCYQEQVIDGTITEVDEETAAQYEANRVGVGTVVHNNGSYMIGSQYMLGKTSGECFAVQATERDAMKGAEAKTASIIKSLEAEHGTENSFQEYEKMIAEKGYLAWEKSGIEIFQNENFEKDVNQILMNQYYGTDIQVDSGTENAVKTEMADTYQFLKSNENTLEQGKEQEMESQCLGMIPDEQMGSIGFDVLEVSDMPDSDVGNDIGNDLENDDDLDI